MRTTASAAQPPHSATRTQDGITVLTALWLIIGLFSDGWAHHNVPGLETFFTPWHGVLYSGFAAAVAWFWWLGRAGGVRWFTTMPSGYGWGVVGIALFAAGGFADMVWHIAFGVESGLDALLSPTHLMLFTGGLLILSSSIRSRWGVGDTKSLVAMVAVALLAALVSFFLLYVNEFASTAPLTPFDILPESDPAHTEAQLPAIAGLAGFLVTTAMFVVPLAFAWQRGPHPKGQLALLIVVLSWLATAVVDFTPASLSGAVGASIGAVVAEAGLISLERRARLGRLKLPVMAAIATMLVWTGHLVALGIWQDIAWSVELVSGVVVLATMAAGALGGLATRHADLSLTEHNEPATAPAPS